MHPFLLNKQTEAIKSEKNIFQNSYKATSLVLVSLVTQTWEAGRKKDPILWFWKIHFSPVELDCGGKTSENITHFTKSVSEGSSLTGKCEAKVCRLTNNICQLRLDFSTFVLAGPSTDTRTTHYTSFGSVVGHSAPSRIAQTSIGE